ncbi:hypothetical protein COCMIDRAFT_31113 [Bipolaris oryzae ATCC 44560]|uniref:Uncharacterized protein n=1 Tax=Bipolaris oryzae ATCC 44560 TaxID=930090 RepID=W6YQB1_COCMI|nr:uncharacterized protein COCMIDRAFT_31113 [Bipolaris oryzae ATCC 44560]EUC39820.1 hypothetical protein COCMIDRAFT_31113 [Bipolaris oryzae ATCC 44560]
MLCPCALGLFRTSLDPAAQSVHMLHANPNLTLDAPRRLAASPPLVIHHAPSAKPLRVMRRQSKVHASHQPGAPPASLVPPPAQPPEGELTDTTRPSNSHRHTRPVASSPALRHQPVALPCCDACSYSCSSSSSSYSPSYLLLLLPATTTTTPTTTGLLSTSHSPPSTVPPPSQPAPPTTRATCLRRPGATPASPGLAVPAASCSTLTLSHPLGHLRTMCSRAHSRSPSPRCASSYARVLSLAAAAALAAPLAPLIRRRPLLYAGRRPSPLPSFALVSPPFSSSSRAPMSIFLSDGRFCEPTRASALPHGQSFASCLTSGRRPGT